MGAPSYLLKNAQRPNFPKLGLCHVVKISYLYGSKNLHMQKYHFRPYSPNQTVLFPERIDKDISPDDPVRLVSAVIDNLDISGIRRLYKACGGGG